MITCVKINFWSSNYYKFQRDAKFSSQHDSFLIKVTFLLKIIWLLLWRMTQFIEVLQRSFQLNVIAKIKLNHDFYNVYLIILSYVKTEGALVPFITDLDYWQTLIIDRPWLLTDLRLLIQLRTHEIL